MVGDDAHADVVLVALLPRLLRAAVGATGQFGGGVEHGAHLVRLVEVLHALQQQERGSAQQHVGVQAAQHGRGFACQISRQVAFERGGFANERTKARHPGQVVADTTPQQLFSDAQRLKKLSLTLPVSVEVAQFLSKDGITLKNTEPLTLDALADEIAEAMRRKENE